MSREHERQPELGRSFRGPRFVAIAILVLGLVVLYATFQIREPGGYSVVGPRVFPFVVAYGLLTLSVIFLVRTTLFPDIDLAMHAATEEATTHWPTVGLTAVALVLYVFALGTLGYVVATMLFFAINASILRGRMDWAKFVRDLLIGLLLSVVIYVSFTRYLGVRLPAGLLDFIL